MIILLILLSTAASAVTSSAISNFKNHYDDPAILRNETWPKINFPYESDTTDRVYLWDESSKTLIDLKLSGQSKFSASLNQLFKSVSTVDTQGNLITSSIIVTSLNSNKTIMYLANQKDCISEDVKIEITVKEFIDRAFDPQYYPTFHFAGQHAPVWDQETLYNVINDVNSQGKIRSSFFYRIDTGSLRYNAVYSDKTQVYDFGQGYVQTNFTIKDFQIKECPQNRQFFE
ncbi:UNKNOWN [Stylonychia lemnae]|uniref:Uncharacterized protein n=1 Tax=Stylonychia lemnae TaxID=5949 RepID=A0A078AMS6_STYLE|nr:UNKNOWN [Stylonychia lemnae]|eukprot:CDW83221.1 UNKNOWN [Stylonychia lemnae]